MTTPRPRLAVLGLDGLSLTMARALTASGACPNLARLALAPEAATLQAELPELSPVNWTSLATAASPGRHGVFGFTRINSGDYTLSLTDALDVACPTIFERLTKAGLTSKVVNLPGAYPVRPIKGLMIAGFVAHDLERAVYPPHLRGVLARENYKLEADTNRGEADLDYLLAELRATLASRRKALELFFDDQAWDLFALVLTETDRLQHFFYPALASPAHARHAAVLDFMRDWDLAVGDFLTRYDKLPRPKRLIALADHGFTELKVEVDLNAWLRRAGYLTYARAPQNEWDSASIGHPTAAFALDPGRIYMHAKERFARGVFHEHIARDRAGELRQALLGLRHEGEPVMEAVYFPEEIYEGPLTRRAADLICLGRPGYSLTGKFGRQDVFGRYGRSGCHTAHGALYYDSAGARPKGPAEAGREILEYFGLEAEKGDEESGEKPLL
ncbi:MAG: alkaline phosphatase family protein [Desulfovibrionaceae bacterium]|nr:alkaline phosphatase family protein [Desulfovibrionaceae bacterium]